MQCSAIILCGGKGERAGGADKGLLDYRGKPLVAWVLDRLEAQADQLLLSANRNLDRYQALGHEVVTDRLANYQGPLAGIAAALPRCRHERVIVAACDMPELPGDLAARLLPKLADHDLSHVWDGERDQYLVAALRAGLAGDLEDYLGAGGRSVRGWYERLRVARVDFSDCPGRFVNLNRPDRRP